MRKRFLSLVFLLLSLQGLVTCAYAQEYTIYNQYHFHYYLLNPALAGATECTHLMLAHKQQWVGMDDSPYTTILSFQTRTIKNLGIGAYLYNDRNGYSHQQGGQFTVAYHIPMARGNRYSKSPSLERQLSLGLSGKFYRYQLDQELVDIFNNSPEQQKIQKKNGIYPNANFGVFFQDYNFFTGLSLTNLMPVEIDIFSEDEPVRPFTGMFQIGYDFEVGTEYLLEPSAVFKMDRDSKTQLDVGFRAIQHVENRDISWWAGIILKQNFDDGYQPMVLLPNFTIRLGKFRLGYAVNIDLNKLVNKSYSSHELMIGYSFCSASKFCR